MTQTPQKTLLWCLRWQQGSSDGSRVDLVDVINRLQSGCLFTDTVGTEELGHLEMIGAIVHQLTRNLKDSQIKDTGFAPYFVDHTIGVYPTSASGSPWNAASMAVKGDPMADLVENLAAEATFH